MNLRQGIHSLSLILALSISACTTSAPVSVFSKFDDLEMSRDFSSQTIQTKPFVVNVSGLEQVAASGDGSEEPVMSSKQAAAFLSEQFQAIRPELRLQNLELTDKTEKKLTEILNRFSINQEFPADGYTFLQKYPLSQSWFLIADLEKAEIHQDFREEDLEDDKGKEIGKKYSFITSRHLDVRYFIYDISTSQLVFTGLVRSTTQAVHDRVRTGSETDAFWSAIAGTAPSFKDTDYPEAPGLKKSLVQNFQKFVRALPSTQGI